jgi:pyrroloquinoline quinone biosynthesis protein B
MWNPFSKQLAALGILIGCALGTSCKSALRTQTPPADRPYVLILGTAQDGGQPQVGCVCERCERARKSPLERRLVTSLLLADPTTGQRFLFDASPDIVEQVEAAKGHPWNRVTPPSDGGGRPVLFDGIFLTHAHMGHYSGLLHLGREAYGARGQALYGTARMGDFLGHNDPWKQSLARGTFVFTEIAQEGLVELSSGLRVHAIRVPHRDEYSDTVAFLIESDRARLLYLPDIDKWEAWGDGKIEALLRTVDFALIDGTFFEEGEIPGRAMSEIPHPFITESMDRFRTLPISEKSKIIFTHFNHTNPASEEGSSAARSITEAGFQIAMDGMLLEL